MKPLGEAHYIAHCFYSPALCRASAAARRLSRHNTDTREHLATGFLRSSAELQCALLHAHELQACSEGQLTSCFVSVGGVASWRQYQCARAQRQRKSSELMFGRTNNCSVLSSLTCPARYGRQRQRRTSRRSPDAQSARQNFTSQGSGNGRATPSQASSLKS